MTIHLLIPIWQIVVQSLLLWAIVVPMLAPFGTLAIVIYYSTQREGK